MSAAGNRAKKHYHEAADNFNRKNNDSSLFIFFLQLLYDIIIFDKRTVNLRHLSDKN